MQLKGSSKQCALIQTENLTYVKIKFLCRAINGARKKMLVNLILSKLTNQYAYPAVLFLYFFNFTLGLNSKYIQMHRS